MPERETKRKGTAKRRNPRTSLLSTGNLTRRSQQARDRALHVLSAMRRDPRLSLAKAAKLQGIKPATVFRHFPSALKKSKGKFHATKSDRYSVTLYVPDAEGNAVAIHTRSSKERKEVSEYLRDLGRHQRGDPDALARWRDRKIAGVELVTDPGIIRNIEPALSDFSLYHTFNGGGL